MKGRGEVRTGRGVRVELDDEGLQMVCMRKKGAQGKEGEKEWKVEFHGDVG